MWEVDKVLTDQERQAGFSLWEDEDILYISRNGGVVTFMSSGIATPEIIHKVIEREMNQ